jgi:hypothetical protein
MRLRYSMKLHCDPNAFVKKLGSPPHGLNQHPLAALIAHAAPFLSGAIHSYCKAEYSLSKGTVAATVTRAENLLIVR